MIQNLKISIIVPVYNVEKYLKECINSIIKQTYRNFELILIDDGSTDESGKICDEYALNENRIQVFHKKNGGQASARNYGIKNSSCDWFCFIDSDDAVHPQLLEYLIKAINEHHVIMSACGNIRNETIRNDFYTQLPYSSKLYQVTENALIEEGGYLSLHHPDQDIDIMWILWAKLVHRDIVQKYPMTNGRIFEDNAIAMAWCHEAKNIAIIDQKMYFYRQNISSTVHKKFSKKNADFLWALEQQLKYSLEFGYFNLYKKIMNNYLATSIYISKRMRNELKETTYSKQILLNAKKTVRINKNLCIDDSIQKKLKTINIMLHPIIYKIKKILIIPYTYIKYK